MIRPLPPLPPASGSNYKASISFLPNETNKTFKFKSVAEASRKFESDSKSLQEKSRETLAKWRKRDRQNRNDKYRDEDMTNFELFSRLTENFENLEDKIKQQETNIIANNQAINLRIDKIEAERKSKEDEDKEKIISLEKRIETLENEKTQREKTNENPEQTINHRQNGHDQTPRQNGHPVPTSLVSSNSILDSVVWPTVSNKPFVPLPQSQPPSQPKSQPSLHIPIQPLPVGYTRPEKKTKEQYTNSPSKETFETRDEEAVKKFADAKHWVGVKLKKGILEKFIWPWLGEQSEHDIIFASQNHTAREECLKHNIEFFCRIHSDDIRIYEHYATISSGVILWFKTDKHIAEAIYKAAPKIRSQEIQIKTYIPSIARDRKRYIDKILLDYKKDVDSDLRFIVKNNTTDLEVLLKSTKPNRLGPYRRIDPAILGEVPDLDLKTEKPDVNTTPDPNAFSTVENKRRAKHGKFVSKKRIYERIDRFLDRCEPISDTELSADEM